MALTIDLAVEHDAWTAHVAGADALDALADRAVRAVLAELRRTDGAELSIVLCDDAFIRALNAQWRGKDRATNVLSFPAAAAARAFTLGDIVVAYETTKREADAFGMPLADYLTHLVVHGLLHLLDFDHETAEDAERMEAMESRVLAALGVASPYREPAMTEDAADLRPMR